MVSELEVAAVLEAASPPWRLSYMGGAVITNRKVKERLLARVRAKGGLLPKACRRSRTRTGYSPAPGSHPSPWRRGRHEAPSIQEIVAD
jgi:hypothetical protein